MDYVLLFYLKIYLIYFYVWIMHLYSLFFVQIFIADSTTMRAFRWKFIRRVSWILYAEIHRSLLKDMHLRTFTVYAIAWLLSDSKWSRRRTGTSRDSCKEFTEATIVIHTRCRIDMTRTLSGMLNKLEFPSQFIWFHLYTLVTVYNSCWF